MSGGKSPQYNGPSVPVVLTEAPQAKGERPPQDRGRHGPQYTEVIPTTSGETSPQGLVKKRPKAPDSEGECAEKTRTKQGEVLHKDKRAVEASSSDHSTESDEGGEVLASSSTTPWQRRVRLRTALEAKRKTQDPFPLKCAGDEGMAEASEYPTRPSCSQGGGTPTLHGWQQQSGQVPVEGYAEDTRIRMVSQHSLWNFTDSLTWGRPTWESRWTPLPPHSLLSDSLTFSPGVKNCVQTERGRDSTS